MSEIITCPSGLSGKIRGMKVREERILSDRKLAKSGGHADKLLETCWEETLEPSIYDFGDQNIDWGKVLQGDRFYAMLQIRALTYGPEYIFSVNCQHESCRSRIEWEIDLNDLPVRDLPEESRNIFQNGNKFETVLPGSGNKIIFGLMTGEQERKLPLIRKNAGNRILSAVLNLRIHELEGIELRKKRQFIEELSMRDANFLTEEFDKVDCGVETGIEIECPECFAVQAVELPFEHSFFMPGKKRKKHQDQDKSFRK